MAKINSELTEIIFAGLTSSITDDTANVAGAADLFDSNLPEGLSPDLVTKVDDYVTDFSAASAAAVGRLGNQLFVEHADVTQVRSSIPMGSFGGSANFSQKRSVERTVPGTDKKVTVYGGMSADIEFTAGKNAGALGAAIREVKKAAAEMYGDKKK